MELKTMEEIKLLFFDNTKRTEAIKFIKEFENGTVDIILGNVDTSNEFVKTKMCIFIMPFIKHFFNITEEELCPQNESSSEK